MSEVTTTTKIRDWKAGETTVAMEPSEAVLETWAALLAKRFAEQARYVHGRDVITVGVKLAVDLTVAVKKDDKA